MTVIGKSYPTSYTKAPEERLGLMPVHACSVWSRRRLLTVIIHNAIWQCC